jgi:hypothetical protein
MIEKSFALTVKAHPTCNPRTRQSLQHGMSTMHTLFILSLSLALSYLAQAQDSAGSTSATQANAAPQPKPSQEELEAKFKALLTNATLTGRWSSTKDGVLGPEREDQYKVVSATKGEGDTWIVSARLEYRGRAFVLPIPVQVKWAGDTAVLVVDNMGMPGGGTTYSARVLFHGQSYVGTWSGGENGGLIYGLIKNEPAPAAVQP